MAVLRDRIGVCEEIATYATELVYLYCHTPHTYEERYGSIDVFRDRRDNILDNLADLVHELEDIDEKKT